MPTCQQCGYKWGWIEAFFKMSYGVPKGYVLAFEIVAYALVIILMPFMPFIYKLSNKDEKMW